MAEQFYIVNGWSVGRSITGQWVIAATSTEEACCIAERRNANNARGFGGTFDIFNAQPDLDRLFDAEETLLKAEG